MIDKDTVENMTAEELADLSVTDLIELKAHYPEAYDRFYEFTRQVAKKRERESLILRPWFKVT